MPLNTSTWQTYSSFVMKELSSLQGYLQEICQLFVGSLFMLSLSELWKSTI